MSDRSRVEELESINDESYFWLKKKDWTRAENCYSRCIDLALLLINTGGNEADDAVLLNARKQEIRSVLVAAYSKRALARRRLQHNEQALVDTDEALKLEPQDVNSLFQKARAAYSLGYFEQACRAFKTASEVYPQENLQSKLLKYLESSKIALEKSRGEVPSSEDFVGPVEIRRVDYANGGRGLFVTRNVEVGELLLVSNPLALIREKSPVHKLIGRLIWELYHQTNTSSHKMVQLYSLWSNRKPQMEIYSMELFRPGNDWVPEDLDKFKLDAGLIHDDYTSDQEKLEIAYGIIKGIVHFNAHLRHERNQRTSRLNNFDGSLGLWVLPSFANHSCSPNVYRSFVGDAVVFRAYEAINMGEELTITYLNERELFEEVEARHTQIYKNSSFKCTCERCLLERTLQPKVNQIVTRLRLAPATFANEVELVIQSQYPELGSKQEGWIRVLFLPWYLLAFNDPKGFRRESPQSRVTLLRLIVDSITSVAITSLALDLGAKLIQESKEIYTKEKKSYQSNLDRVLDIYKLEFGNQPNSVLCDLIRARQVRRDSTKK